MLCPEFHAECWETAFPRTLKKPERDKINLFLRVRDRLSHVSSVCGAQEQGLGSDPERWLAA